MKRCGGLCIASVIVILLLLTMERAPAPVSEIVETPAPTATPVKSTAAEASSRKQQQATPAPAKPRVVRKSPAVASPSVTARPQVSAFAGRWTGFLPWSFFGNLQFTLLVDPSQTSVTRICARWPERPVVRPEIRGGTLIARFPGLHGTFELTPSGDGRTAEVHATAPTVNAVGVFRRE